MFEAHDMFFRPNMYLAHKIHQPIPELSKYEPWIFRNLLNNQIVFETKRLVKYLAIKTNIRVRHDDGSYSSLSTTSNMDRQLLCQKFSVMKKKLVFPEK